MQSFEQVITRFFHESALQKAWECLEYYRKQAIEFHVADDFNEFWKQLAMEMHPKSVEFQHMFEKKQLGLISHQEDDESWISSAEAQVQTTLARIKTKR